MNTNIENIFNKYPQTFIYHSKIYNKDVDLKNWIYKRLKNSNADFMKEYEQKVQTGLEKFDKFYHIFNDLHKIIDMFKNDLLHIIVQISKEFLPSISETNIRNSLKNNDFGIKIDNIKFIAKMRIMRGESISNIHRDLSMNEIYLEFCLALYSLTKL